MAPARALSTGLGIVSDGLELPLNELPEWEESKIKTFPVVSLMKYTYTVVLPLRVSLIEVFCF